MFLLQKLLKKSLDMMNSLQMRISYARFVSERIFLVRLCPTAQHRFKLSFFSTSLTIPKRNYRYCLTMFYNPIFCTGLLDYARE